MKIGLMVGREYSFPPAFIERVNTLGRPHGITADFVKLAGTKMDEAPPWRVIVDRISHEVEYYRGDSKRTATVELSKRPASANTAEPSDQGGEDGDGGGGLFP